MIMNSNHPDWQEFRKLLKQDIGNCNGKMTKTRKILRTYFQDLDIMETFNYFEANGAYCDCEILLNIK